VVDLVFVEAVLKRAWRRESEWHGETHWRCVAATVLDLVGSLAAGDPELVLLFGLLHDTRRENEHVDPGHGPRAAGYARELVDEGVLGLQPARLELLCHAIAEHTNGRVSADPTVGACWDADRLHLQRVSIEPDPARFSTPHAHGAGPLAAAARLRAAPPSWAELVAAARPRRANHF
jgi:uncharacterized protein